MFFERPTSGHNTILVHVSFRDDSQECDFEEFEELAASAGASIVATILSKSATPTSSHLLGSGKLAEVEAAVSMHRAGLVLVSRRLSPGQERNLEKFLKCRVLDRTGLILDIFAQRARSHEGKLQVELAQLQHLSSRLKRGWSHLDRQKGGIGLRGAGEKQLELDQRMIGQRIKSINKSLLKVRKQRGQSRRSRTRAELSTICLVGYTNAGKSTLFNNLTCEKSYVANQLFATLDSTLRKMDVNNFGRVVVADTVGFVRQLPHTLIDAFRATLEEVASSNLLIHVVDCADDDKIDRIQDVNEVLKEIGAEHIPQIIVYNKIDKCADIGPNILNDEDDLPREVWVSAKDSLGIELLHQAIAARLSGVLINTTVRLVASLAKTRSELYEKGFVESEHVDDTGASFLKICLPRIEFGKLLERGAKRVALPELVDEDVESIVVSPQKKTA